MYSRVIESIGPELAVKGTECAETTYRFYIFLPRCDTYAIRFAGSEVTGVYGPLEYEDVRLNALSNFPYEGQVDCVAWVKANLSDFVSCDAEYEEGMVRI